MARVYRLIFGILGLLVFPVIAQEVEQCKRYFWPQYVVPGSGYYWTKEEACDVYIAYSYRGSPGIGAAVEGEKCYAVVNGQLVGNGRGIPWELAPCPEEEPITADEWCDLRASYWNSTLHGANSREGVVETNQLKPLDEPWLTCRANDDGFEVDGQTAPPGCLHTFTPTMRGSIDENGPYKYWGDSWAVGGTGSNTHTGLACVPGLDNQPGDPPDALPEKKPDDECKKGFAGSVNGVSVCIDPSSAHTEGVDWTQVMDGQGNTKEIKTEVKCDGEKCTIKTTTKTPGGTDDNTTTTTTTRGAYCAKNPESSVCKGATDPSGSTRNQNGRGGPGDPAGGGGGGGGGDGKDGKGFCEENPNSPQCKESSFGGSCASNFACDGDAIQCAMAREQHVRACKLFDDQSAESRLYDEHKGKTGNQTIDLEGNETINLANLIDTSDSLGGGSCISDQSITVWGRSITLPLSAICADLAMLGNLLVAVSMLLAMRIITRG